MSAGRILILDDEPELLESLDRLLSGEGYECTRLDDPGRVRVQIAEVHPDVLITDLRMPGADGMTVLAAAHADDPLLPVILMTGYATVASAVGAMREGAFDYLAKPFSGDQLSVSVARALRFRRLALENRRLRALVSEEELPMVGSSVTMVRLGDQIRRVARAQASVLVTGESGTGKELVARSVHALSDRASGPFVAVDCAALPEGLLESELYGHEKGAFTGAVSRKKGLIVEAHGGTLFLDEVGELPLTLQAKLLRVLEERQVRPVGSARHTDVDIRLVAATNRDLGAGVREGTFREDLYYRLNVVHLQIPPLREREDDVLILAEHFLRRFAERSGRPAPRMPRPTWEALRTYPWPGNVRQLRNVIERVVALDDDGVISPADLPTELWEEGNPLFEGGATVDGDVDEGVLAYEEARDTALRRFQRRYVDRLLDEHQGNVTRSAEAAGVSRRTVHRWMADLAQEDDPAGSEP